MRPLFVLSMTACLAAAATAEEAAKPGAAEEQRTAPVMVSYAEMRWTALPERPGMEFAVLSGDPKTGAYTQIRKVPAGSENPLHSHGSELKNVIISGVWYTGENEASARDFGPGSVIVMPANWVHVSGCRKGTDCVFYQEGKGKFSFHPVEKADAD